MLNILKLKTSADDKLILTQMMNFVIKKTENIVGNGETAGYLSKVSIRVRFM